MIDAGGYGDGESSSATLVDFVGASPLLRSHHIYRLLKFLKWFVVIFYKYEQKFVFSFLFLQRNRVVRVIVLR